MKDKIQYPEEIIIMDTKRNNMNKDIYLFRKEHSDYEILTISVYGTGGQFGGTSHYQVIWKKR